MTGNDFGLDLPPVDADTGPFPSRAFIETWWSHFGRGSLAHVSCNGGDAWLWLDPAGTVRFAGDADLTDYHTLAGVGAAHAVADFVVARPPGTPFALNSLPVRAADEIEAALTGCGLAVARRRHEVCLRVELPASYAEYLADLSKKERHEVRRKAKRLTERLGTPVVTSGTGRDFDDFVILHRASRGPKGRFMDEAHAAFFHDLQAIGATVHVLRDPGGSPLAALFGFAGADVYYLYNSAYDTSLTSLSPGIVLIATMIRRLIEGGYRMMDFLKGDEGYKFRLGAHPRPLFELTGET